MPAKGQPFPGFGHYMSYEDVLDHSDVVIAGRVVRHTAPATITEGREMRDEPGRIELEVQQVLFGDYPGKTATILYGIQAIAELAQTNGPACFLCMRTLDATLRLTGDPPEGGGFVREGPEYAAKLIEAAKDPARGLESPDPAVRLSAACRFVRSWVDTPADKRPKAPTNLVETVIQGLAPTEQQGPNIGAAARDAVNVLFGCDLNAIWSYSVRQGRGRRIKQTKDVRAAWDRTIEAVRKRRAERANTPDPLSPETQAAISKLIEKLGSEDYPERQSAQDDLLKIGQPALRLLKAGSTHENPQIAQGCRLLVNLIGKLRDYRPQSESYVFDLDRAEPFVPGAAKKAEGKPEP